MYTSNHIFVLKLQLDPELFGKLHSWLWLDLHTPPKWIWNKTIKMWSKYLYFQGFRCIWKTDEKEVNQPCVVITGIELVFDSILTGDTKTKSQRDFNKSDGGHHQTSPWWNPSHLPYSGIGLFVRMKPL